MAGRGQPAIDLLGQRFNRWTVIGRAENMPGGQARWLCRCECGTERVLKSIIIRRGLSKSCGCWRSENNRLKWTKHGHNVVGDRSPTYDTWASMIARCTNSKRREWPRYGGRGITVCDRWLHSFENFLADMGEKPEGMSIDRIDNDKGYYPENCRWQTDKGQARNKSSNRLIAAHGETHCLVEWAEMMGTTREALRSRLKRLPVEQAIRLPEPEEVH